MRKIDWKGICELIAVLCTGMGLGMEICINKFSIDKIGNDFYGTINEQIPKGNQKDRDISSLWW